jgi:hypothetical protein
MNLPQEFLEQLSEACMVQTAVPSVAQVEGHGNLCVALDVPKAEPDPIEALLVCRAMDCKVIFKLPCYGRVVCNFHKRSLNLPGFFGSQVLQCVKLDVDGDLVDIRYHGCAVSALLVG